MDTLVLACLGSLTNQAATMQHQGAQLTPVLIAHEAEAGDGLCRELVLDIDGFDPTALEALDREIQMARRIAAGAGLLAVNVMRAVSQYADYVRQSCASGAEAIT